MAMVTDQLLLPVRRLQLTHVRVSEHHLSITIKVPDQFIKLNEIKSVRL